VGKLDQEKYGGTEFRLLLKFYAVDGIIGKSGPTRALSWKSIADVLYLGDRL